MNKKILIPLLIAVAAIGFLAYRCFHARTANGEPVRIYLPDGSSYAALCDSLQASHIFVSGRTPVSFHLKAKALGLDRKSLVGSYVIEAHISEFALLRKLRNRQQDPVKLTLGKFRRPADLDAYLCRRLMHDDFNVSLDSFHFFLPNTYEVYWNVSPQALTERMRTEYNRFWTRETKGDLHVSSDSLTLQGLRLSKRDVVVLASIVEEETLATAEKSTIASVYINRLKRNMPLQADPTVKYAVGDFSLRRILNKHLATPSPFNTYLHTGLPPAPICTPSPVTIRQVLRAPETPYLYFCASPAMDGTHLFAATLAQHNRNAAAFHAALDRRNIR